MKAVSYSISVENVIPAIKHMARYKVGLNRENSFSSISNTLYWSKFPRNELKWVILISATQNLHYYY